MPLDISNTTFWRKKPERETHQQPNIWNKSRSWKTKTRLCRGKLVWIDRIYLYPPVTQVIGLAFLVNIPYSSGGVIKGPVNDLVGGKGYPALPTHQTTLTDLAILYCTNDCCLLGIQQILLLLDTPLWYLCPSLLFSIFTFYRL